MISTDVIIELRIGSSDIDSDLNYTACHKLT